MDDLSATLEVSSSKYSSDLFCKNSCLLVFSSKRLTNDVLVQLCRAYVWFKYLATKSCVSLLLLHVMIPGWNT